MLARVQATDRLELVMFCSFRIDGTQIQQRSEAKTTEESSFVSVNFVSSL
jgi:hypothetical protein